MGDAGVMVVEETDTGVNKKQTLGYVGNLAFRFSALGLVLELSIPLLKLMGRKFACWMLEVGKVFQQMISAKADLLLVHPLVVRLLLQIMWWSVSECERIVQ